MDATRGFAILRDAAYERPRLGSPQVAKVREQSIEQNALIAVDAYREPEPEASSLRNREVVVVKDAVGSTEPNGLIEAQLLDRSPRQQQLWRSRSAQNLK
jgi:hypothetical protein